MKLDTSKDFDRVEWKPYAHGEINWDPDAKGTLFVKSAYHLASNMGSLYQAPSIKPPLMGW